MCETVRILPIFLNEWGSHNLCYLIVSRKLSLLHTEIIFLFFQGGHMDIVAIDNSFTWKPSPGQTGLSIIHELKLTSVIHCSPRLIPNFDAQKSFFQLGIFPIQRTTNVYSSRSHKWDGCLSRRIHRHLPVSFLQFCWSSDSKSNSSKKTPSFRRMKYDELVTPGNPKPREIVHLARDEHIIRYRTRLQHLSHLLNNVIAGNTNPITHRSIMLLL